ncbi:MAG: TIGR03087 family PEP-CTERM/XrtA system glycosyltransferase [Rhodocyclaceae bacterium]|nr:MAG: TIGR03087 family PEP-CTERM/XrtA system glycosyltransferase [Rhodocyclaceae bacterium]
MNILFICHRFPYPPVGGAKVRAFHMIRHLSGQGHRVTVCSLARSEDEVKEGKGIAPFCEGFEMAVVKGPVQVLRMVTSLVTPGSASEAFFYSPELQGRIDSLLEEKSWDLIVVHCSSVARYVENVNHIPKLLDYCDMDSQKWLEYVRYRRFPVSAGYWLEGRKILNAEKRIARKFDLGAVATVAEQRTLDSFNTGVLSGWFPNGVDTDFFIPSKDEYDENIISFIGRMDYYPNEECMRTFCQNTLPLLQTERPKLQLFIVGAEPSAGVRKLGDLPGVTVTGSVPDVRPYVWRSALTVAPLNIARGTQNKILEAMAMGVPVVTSSIATGGVDADKDVHFLVADTPSEYASAILQILSSPGERRRLSHAGRERMLARHTWSRAMERLDDVIERCVTRFNLRQR